MGNREEKLINTMWEAVEVMPKLEDDVPFVIRPLKPLSIESMKLMELAVKQNVSDREPMKILFKEFELIKPKDALHKPDFDAVIIKIWYDVIFSKKVTMKAHYEHVVDKKIIKAAGDSGIEKIKFITFEIRKAIGIGMETILCGLEPVNTIFEETARKAIERTGIEL